MKTFGSDARGPFRAGHPVAVFCGLLAVLLAFAWGRVYERHILQPQLETVIRLRDAQQAKAYACRMRFEDLQHIASDCLVDHEALREQFAKSIKGDWFIYKPRPGDNVPVVMGEVK